MKVGLKLFDKNNKVVVERDVLPVEASGSGVILYQGTHYSYGGLMGSRDPREDAYARFNECEKPYELV